MNGHTETVFRGQPNLHVPLNLAGRIGKTRRGLFGAKSLSTAVNTKNEATAGAAQQRPMLQQPVGVGTPINDQPPAATGPLGGSMREPFNYEAALQAMTGPVREPTNGLGTRVLGEGWEARMSALGSLMTGDGGAGVQQYHAGQNEQAQRLQDAAAKLADYRYKDWARQNQADLDASGPVTIGRNRVGYNPATGQTDVLYQGAEDHQIYAENLGYTPGSPEYFQAVEDHVLRGSGPSAHERDIEMDDHRTGNDERLESVRYGNRVNLENLRQGHRESLEGRRQKNRVGLRQTPPASRGRAPARESLPVMSSPSEARSKLKSGDRFRTPAGQVKVVP